MATIRKRTNRKGTVWQIDYYDPQGKRVMKCFPLKKDAEAGRITVPAMGANQERVYLSDRNQERQGPADSH